MLPLNASRSDAKVKTGKGAPVLIGQARFTRVFPFDASAIGTAAVQLLRRHLAKSVGLCKRIVVGSACITGQPMNDAGRHPY